MTANVSPSTGVSVGAGVYGGISVGSGGVYDKGPDSVLAVLAKYGADAHMWLPGVGTIDGITAANFQDTAAATPAVVDSPVGRANDVGGGAINLTATPDANRPVLRVDANGKYCWQLNGTNHRLTLGAPAFQLTDNFCVVVGVSLDAAGTERAIFSQSNASNNALPEFMFNAAGKLGVYAQGGGATINAFDGPSNGGVGPIVATLVCRSLAMSVRRNGAEVASGTLSGTYTTATSAGLGTFARLTPAEFLPGNIYPAVVIKGNVSPADLVVLEQFVDRHTTATDAALLVDGYPLLVDGSPIIFT